jgi:Zn-dependent peptidase ImmA (M78 family)
MTEAARQIYATRSVDTIREIAEQLRRLVDYSDAVAFPIMHVIESKLDQEMDALRLEIWSDGDMCGYEGLTFRDADGDRLVLAEKVYEAACRGEWRARRIAAHELGHWLLHTSIYRRDMFGFRYGIKCFINRESAILCLEDVADIFSVELLMPVKHVLPGDTALDLSLRFGAPIPLAEARLAAARNVWNKKQNSPRFPAK